MVTDNGRLISPSVRVNTFIVILNITMVITFAVYGTRKPIGQIPVTHNTDLSTELAGQVAYPLKVSGNERYLVDQNDVPYFMVGDSAWMLISQPTTSDADYYLSKRQQKGINTLMVMLIDHSYATNAPRNYYGEAPFTGKVFTTPNEAYFAHVDEIISAAAQKGMNVLLAPLYLGFGCGSQGWCAEVQAASLSDMIAWGQYVGNRYKNYANLIWIMDGDADPSLYPGVQSKVSAFVTGLKQYDNVHLITSHNSRGQMAVTPWSGASWLTLNNIYTDELTYPLAQTAYTNNPSLPFFAIETHYENEHGMTQQQLRAEGYWTYLSGGFGYIFGNCPVWNMGAKPDWCDSTTDWKAALDSPGSINVTYMGRLFMSLPWQKLVPDWDHVLILSGYGTFGGSDYATAAGTSDGKLVLVYLPSIRTITVDMSKLSGMVTARWYDPTNGSYVGISDSPFANTGTKQFSSPGTNSSGDGDWVLILETNSSTLPMSTQSLSMQSMVVAPDSLVTQGGSTSGSLSSLGLLEQIGTDNNPVTYVSFQTSGSVYFGYQTFHLPSNVIPSLISSMLLQVNFNGQDPLSQTWSFSIYDWNTQMWIKFEDTTNTNANQWNTITSRIKNITRYVSPGREVRIHLQSSNSSADAKLDYEAIHITYRPESGAPAAVAPAVPALRPGIASVR